jgi:mycofactocin biosynthesis protein MftB
MTATVHADTTTFAERPWELSPSVALRPEPFGALAYDFDTRQLSFLKTPRLVQVVRLLGELPDAATALRRAGVDGASAPAYLAALEGLARTGIIRERAA